MTGLHDRASTTRGAISAAGIPENVVPDRSWTRQMVELADHIGPAAALRIVDHYGGCLVSFGSERVERELTALVGEEKARILQQVYGAERIQLPTGRHALRRARRAHVVAAVRAGSLSYKAACLLLGTSRTYLSFLVNHTDEGRHCGTSLDGVPTWAGTPEH